MSPTQDFVGASLGFNPDSEPGISQTFSPGRAKASWRRFPNLRYRRFPNRPRNQPLGAPAGLTTRDTADLEACAAKRLEIAGLGRTGARPSQTQFPAPSRKSTLMSSAGAGSVSYYCVTDDCCGSRAFHPLLGERAGVRAVVLTNAFAVWPAPFGNFSLAENIGEPEESPHSTFVTSVRATCSLRGCVRPHPGRLRSPISDFEFKTTLTLRDGFATSLWA